jgi:peptidyl-prolyl cis-trans isomerase SurA
MRLQGRVLRCLLSLSALLLSVLACLPAPVHAASYRVLATVDDEPITEYDVDQRIKLRDALGYRPDPGDQRKKVLQSLIDDVVVRMEAKRNKIDVNDKQIDESIEKLAKGSNTTVDGLRDKLKEKGVSLGALKRHVTSTIIMRWLMSSKDSQKKTTADPGEIDRRMASISSDPRFKPVLLYQIIQIDLPVEQSAGAMRDQLIYARAIEGRQLVERYKGCGSLRQAADGIFNVKINRQIEAMAERLPPEMRKVLEQAGTKRLIGPMPSQDGVRLIAFCGKRTAEPPKPTREMVENLILNEKYSADMDSTIRELRRKSFVDYKDASPQSQ